MDLVNKKQTQNVKINPGRLRLRQEQKAVSGNIKSLNGNPGWREIKNILTNNFITCFEDIFDNNDVEKVLTAVCDAKAILNLARSINSAINVGEQAAQMLEDHFSGKKKLK